MFPMDPPCLAKPRVSASSSQVVCWGGSPRIDSFRGTRTSCMNTPLGFEQSNLVLSHELVNGLRELRTSRNVRIGKPFFIHHYRLFCVVGCVVFFFLFFL